MNKILLIALLAAGLFACTTVQRDDSPALLRVLPPLEVHITVPEVETEAVEAPPVEVEVNSPQQALEVRQLCEEIGNKLGSVSVKGCLSHALVHDGKYTTDGRPLVYKDYAKDQEELAKVLVVGGIHGDEYSSFSLLFRWMERLDGDAAYANRWRLLPMTNPDGLLSFKRAQRMNANGVDQIEISIPKTGKKRPSYTGVIKRNQINAGIQGPMQRVR